MLQRSFLVLALASLVVTTARADAITGPPGCPPGSRGMSSHAGQSCVPSPCEQDSDCLVTGETCQPYRVCTRLTDVRPHRRRPRDTPPREVTLAVASCPVAAACQGDEEPPPPTIGTVRPGAPTCADGNFCVPPGLPDLAPRTAPTESTSGAAPGSAPGATSSSSGAASNGAPAATRGCACALGERTPGALGALMVSVGLGLALALRRRR